MHRAAFNLRSIYVAENIGGGFLFRTAEEGDRRP